MTDINIRDIIDSLLTDETNNQPIIPDGTIDLSSAIAPLRRLTLHGRALDSTEENSIGKMIGQLLDEYIPDNYCQQHLANCVFGLSVLLAQIFRSINSRLPHISVEEFLIKAASQDSIMDLQRVMSCTPTTMVNDRERPMIAQCPIFHQPIPLLDEAIEEFGAQHIDPYSDEEQLNFDLIFEMITNPDRSTRLVERSTPPEISIHSRAITDPLNGFDNIIDAYFRRKPEGDIEPM
jgi:hypothetical protein